MIDADNQTSWLPEVSEIPEVPKALKQLFWMFHKAANTRVFPAEEQRQGVKLGAICQLTVIRDCAKSSRVVRECLALYFPL